MKNRITNDEFQENIKSKNIDTIHEDLFVDFKNKIIKDTEIRIKQKLSSQIDIRESIQKEEMMNTVISDQQSNEWNYFRKIVNDL